MAAFYDLVKDEMDDKVNRQHEDASALNSATASVMNGAAIGLMTHGGAPTHGSLQPMPLGQIRATVNNVTNNNNTANIAHMRHHDVDANQIDPITRGRSHTWPVTSPNFGEPEETQEPAVAAVEVGNPVSQPDVPGPPTKKNTSRRNPWGNLSYADLIAKAISSSPDNRATLSQVYDWMVTNIPYFKDKGDSNSSAGWKVSQFWK